MPRNTPPEPSGLEIDPAHENLEGAGDGPQFRHEIASDVVLSGRIHFPADARVDGRLKGEVHADQLLLIGPKAEVNARIRAQALVIKGTLTGDVIESGEVRIAGSGRVFGSIQARSLTVEAGARFEGRVRSYASTQRKLLEAKENATPSGKRTQSPIAENS